MATVTTRKVAQAGSTPAPVAASVGGDQIPGTPRTILRVVNGGGSSITVTVNSQQNCDQGFDHDLAVAVPAGATREIGPFGQRFYDSNGFVQVTYSAVTTVTVEAIEVP